MQKETFKFSVVIPIYNVEGFLAETIDSVIAQDIGFEQNIQMILVNDGSPDHSEEICLAYQKKYPDNIVYVKQENAGVSAARNHGMDYVKGKYVNFLDSDDKWSPDAFSCVYRFFEKHYEQVDLVSCKQEFFEGQTGPHPLSKKKYEDGDRVTDILTNFEDLQLHITASFLKAEIMRDEQFDTGLKYGEDALYVNEIILKKHRYGLVAQPTHYYRKRANNSSAVQNKRQSPEWYFTTPKLFYGEVIRRSEEKFGAVIPYVQYLIAYEMQWRLKDEIDEFLTPEQITEYLAVVKKLLDVCDDDILVAPEQIYVQQKIYLLSLKYGCDITKEFKYVEQKLFFRNLVICDLGKTFMFSVDVLRVRSQKLYISGQIWTYFYDKLRFWLVDERGELYNVNAKPSAYRELKIWGKTVISNHIYEMELPLEDGRRFDLRGEFDGKYPIYPKLVKRKFAKLSDEFYSAYYEEGGYIITQGMGWLKAQKSSAKLRGNCEKKFREEMRRKLEGPELLEIQKEEILEGFKFRKAYFARKRFHKKRIWLITDRINLAGDNGEAFFRYVASEKTGEVDAYFVISSESKDYERMKRIGKVIPYKSFKHKLYTLFADKIISSQGEDNIVNPFDTGKMCVGDLFHYQYVFLQHGITKDDLSIWLNKFNKNIDLFVTAAYPEYKSILDGDYHYDERVVKLVGFPRFDSLVQDKKPEKTIIFLPTWRTELAIEMDQKTGIRPYNTEFKKSDYYQFYQKLINDERLVAAMKRCGYRGKFCVHTNNLPNASDFTGNEVIKVVAEAIDYQKEFKENALLITDYSSVAYDFAFLQKPVIYTQSDRKAFFAGQMYDEGYWDYDSMGFGPVCKDYESTVNAIIAQVEAGCVLEDVYKKRIEAFYYAFDRNNCQRVFEAIEALNG